MPEYRPIELLKTAKQLISFDAICVGGPLHGQFRALGSLPVQQLTEVIDSYTKSRVGNMRSFPYRLGSHMKYRLSLVRRGLVYLAWLHDSVPCAINSELLGSFNAALEFSQPSAPDEELYGPAPFKRHDEVFIRGSSVYQHRCVVVDQCIFRDGKWWFNTIGDPCLREAACYQTYEEPAESNDWMDTESENAAKDATPDPKHKVLSDDEMFGPTKFIPNVSGSTLPIGRQYADAFVSPNRSIAPFRVGQMVRWKSKGTTHIVEAIRYVESDKCWAIRIPGHDRPYDAAIFEAIATSSVSTPPPADPQPLGARPRRRIIRKERPQ